MPCLTYSTFHAKTGSLFFMNFLIIVGVLRMKMLKFTLLIFVILFYVASLFAEEITLKMVYKNVGKPPFMEKAPDNSGLYKDLITCAVNKIGCKLKIKRVPKKRGYVYLEEGTADIYAMGFFRESRSKYLFYIPNGFSKVEELKYGLTSDNIPEIISIEDMKNYKLKLLIDIGSPLPTHFKKMGIPYYEVIDANLEKAVLMLSAKRPYLYMTQISILNEYMKKNNIDSMGQLEIKVHKTCCGVPPKKRYTCFSRFSPHYKERPNPLYNKTEPLSADNFPFELVPGTIPYRLEQAFQEMVKSGKIEALRKKYKVTPGLF